MLIRILYIGLTCLLLQNTCHAQDYLTEETSNWLNTNKWSIDVDFKRGTIFKHTPKFLPEVTEASNLYEISLIRKTRGEKNWHLFFGFPELGLTALHASFGDKDIFGQAWGLLPSIRFITHKNRFKIHYHIGLGLAYLTKPHDPITNPDNNVIGSPWNNLTMLMLKLEYQLNKQLQLLASASFTHFSNGRSQIPNLGINVPAPGIHLRYSFNAKKEENQALSEVYSLKLDKKPILFNIRIGMGIAEEGGVGGPKYPVYTFNTYLSKRLNRVGQLHLGVEYNFYQGVYHYILNQDAFAEKEYWMASKLSPYIAYELFFGRIAGIVSLGAYLHDPFFEREATFFKIGIHYYPIQTYERWHKQLYFGLYLKTHYAAADFAEFGIGYTF